MGFTAIKDYSAEEVGLWLTAQGLGDKAPAFVEEGVDGDLLLSLTIDDLKNDLGLSGLQSKKVLKNIEFSKELLASAGGGGGGEEAEKLKEDKEELKTLVLSLTGDKDTLQEKVQALEDALQGKNDEIAELKKQMEGMTMTKSAPPPAPAPAPTPAPAPAPKSAPAPAPRRRGRGVIGGAATGAAGGAAKGAIVGAILPGMDASDGAKAGAAVGAAKGGVGGLRGRRRLGR